MRSGVWSHRNPAVFHVQIQQKRPAYVLDAKTGLWGDSTNPGLHWSAERLRLKRWKVSFGLVVKERYVLWIPIYNLQIWCQWPGRNATWFFHDVRPGIMIWLYTSGELLGCRRTMRSICFAVLMNQSGLHLLALMALFSQFLCQAVPKKSPTNLVFRCPPSNPLGFFLLYRCLTHHFLHVSRTACFLKKLGVPSTKPRRFPTSSEKYGDFFY